MGGPDLRPPLGVVRGGPAPPLKIDVKVKFITKKEV